VEEGERIPYFVSLWAKSLGEPTTILPISMEMKPHGKSLGHNPLSDAPYRNTGIVLNGQGPSRHPLGDRNPGIVLNGQGLSRHPLGGAPYLDLVMVLSEQGSGHCILSDALHCRPGVVKNEQVSSHLTRRMRRVRKLAEPSRVCVGTCNVGSLTGKL
jgi:hypothetical protein